MNASRPRLSVLKRFRCACEGIVHVLRTQRNAPLHVLGIAGVIALGLWLGIDRTEWALVATVTALVVVAEALNTAIETVVDHVQPDHHPLAKVSKDVAAGAVLLAVVAAVIVGLLVFLPPLLDRLQSL